MRIPTITTGQRIAAEIEALTNETLRHVESQLTRIYWLANTPGEQAAICEAFGTHGTSALAAYEAFRAALTTGMPSHTVREVNVQVFQPQADGSVIYVAPQPAPAEPLPDFES